MCNEFSLPSLSNVEIKVVFLFHLIQNFELSVMTSFFIANNNIWEFKLEPLNHSFLLGYDHVHLSENATCNSVVQNQSVLKLPKLWIYLQN